MPSPNAPVVLVVDDHQDLRETLAELLSLEGYQVATAADGAEALRYLQDGGCPCIVLLDHTMPVMNGWEFLARTRQDELAVFPVAVVSAVVDEPFLDHQPEPVAYFRKPFDIPALLATVASYCALE